jgi:hypothetical protein
VISRHDQPRTRQRLKKLTRFRELADACALSKISGDGDQIRCDVADCRDERRDDPAIQPAEMQIR